METFLECFHAEAVERLERLSSGLISLERSADDATLINDLFREAHSLKGAAGVTGLADVAEICHKMEDLLSELRKGSEEPSPALIDALLDATDAVQKMVAATAEQRDHDVVPGVIIEKLDSVEHSTGTTRSARAEETATVSPIEEPSPSSCDKAQRAELVAEVGRGSRPVLDGSKEPSDDSFETAEPEPDAGFRADDLSPGRPSAESSGSVRRPATTPEVESSGSVGRPAATHGSGSDTVRLRVDMLESLGNLTGELIVAGDRLQRRFAVVKELHHVVRSERKRHADNHPVHEALAPIATAVHKLIDDFSTDVTVIEPLIAEIHEQVLDTRMLPLSVLFDQLPRFSRDYCRHENKQVELHVDGAEARVDRHVLEELHDPIIHLIRNSLAHGIESPEQREKMGKPPVGTVRLSTSRCGDRIQITCEDDGRGIDRQKVLAKAVSSGLVTEADATELSGEEIDSLILRPGFSTAELITDVSGRGVGMDVVASRLAALRGTLGIQSAQGKYTRFVLEFPASVATLEGLLVKAAGFTYVVPTVSVVRTVRIKRSDLQAGAGGEVLFSMDGQAVPLVMLASLLEREGHRSDSEILPAVVVQYRGCRVALGVDRLLGTKTIVAKGLGEHIRDVRGVAGATILGTGLPALILDPGQIVGRSDLRLQRHEWLEDTNEIEEDVAPVLVVDDSLTTRMMEKSILESAGYTVDTAVSAEDALAKVDDCDYRLFIVDVEMPGLNGFQLTRKLRQNERFVETPIIIVTSLAKEEHRRIGLEVGANAYIVKAEFDQNNLLDTVERLVGT